MNSRHPYPRRVRTGGPEQQSADGIRGIRWIRRDPGMGSFFQFSIVKIGTLCFLPSPLCGEMGGRGLKHCKTQYFWHLDFRRGFPGAQEAQAPPSGARVVFPNNVFLTNEPSKNDGEMLSTSFCSKFRCASF